MDGRVRVPYMTIVRARCDRKKVCVCVMCVGVILWLFMCVWCGKDSRWYITVDVWGDRGGVGGSQSGESLPVLSQWDGRKSGAALGWTAAFPKRNTVSPSTHDRRRGEERIVCMWGCGPVHQYRQAKGVCVHETRPACMWTYARTHTKRRTFKCPPKYTHTNLTT